MLLLAGFFPNEIWRVLGLWVGGGLREDSEVLIFVRMIASAILAGVIAQIVITPPGLLASIPLAVRLGAIGAGVLVYSLLRRSVFFGVLAAEAVIVIGRYMLG